MINTSYFSQTRLLIQVLPFIAEEKDFALKGGTAINLFFRDIPRLSVDIGLTYLPLKKRDETIKDINEKLLNIAKNIRTKIYGATVLEIRPFGTKEVSKLSVSQGGAKIIIEPNLTLRGYVYPPTDMSLLSETESLFGQTVSMRVMSFADVYGGKICAALDRQHPRDLFDVQILMKNEGVTEEIRKAFLVYLISGDRPIHELLNPNRIDIRSTFAEEFQTMTKSPVTVEQLIETREILIQTIKRSLTDLEKEFLLSLKHGTPNWELLGIQGVERLPGVQWKLINIKKMNATRQKQQLDNLRSVLEMEYSDKE